MLHAYLGSIAIGGINKMQLRIFNATNTVKHTNKQISSRPKYNNLFNNNVYMVQAAPYYNLLERPIP